MIRVMIVDDEPPFFRYIKNMIEEADNQFEVVGSALDGMEALDKIPVVMPDVLFTDIKMPVMDGIKLIEELKEKYPGIITVIISAHDDFKYARKALILNAEDYLLKPVTMVALRELLSKLRKKYSELYDKKQMETLKAVTMGKTFNDNSYINEYECYSIFLVCAGSYCKYNMDHINAGKVFWERNNLADSFKDFLSPGISYWIFEDKKENERIVVFASKTQNYFETKHISEIIQNKYNCYDIPITTVFKPLLQNAGSLAVTVQMLRKTLFQKLIFAQSSIVNIDDLQSAKDIDNNNSSMFNNLMKLKLSIENKNVDYFKTGLSDFLKICRDNNTPQCLLENMLNELYDSIKDMGSAISPGNKGDIESSFEIDELISNSVSYRQISDGLVYKYDDSITNAAKKDKKDNYHQKLLKGVEDYLDENLKQTITLQSLAETFTLAPNYLSSLFKKYKGVTPGEYLTMLRIQKAIELMKENPNMLIKQISKLVGYNDQLYFSRIFKKVMGKAPVEFKDNN